MKTGEIWGKKATTGFFLFYKIGAPTEPICCLYYFGQDWDTGKWMASEEVEEWKPEVFKSLYIKIADNQAELEAVSDEGWKVLHEKMDRAKSYTDHCGIDK